MFVFDNQRYVAFGNTQIDTWCAHITAVLDASEQLVNRQILLSQRLLASVAATDCSALASQSPDQRLRVGVEQGKPLVGETVAYWKESHGIAARMLQDMECITADHFAEVAERISQGLDEIGAAGPLQSPAAVVLVKGLLATCSQNYERSREAGRQFGELVGGQVASTCDTLLMLFEESSTSAAKSAKEAVKPGTKAIRSTGTSKASATTVA